MTGADVTEFQAGGQARGATEAQVRRVLDGMSEGLVLIDRDFRVVEINAAGLRLEGRSRDEVVGRQHAEIWPDAQATEFGERLRRAMTTRAPFSHLNHYAWPDGREGWFEVHVDPLDDGLAIFYRDVTDRKRAEDRRLALVELSDRIRDLDDPDELAYAAAEVLGRTLNVSRAGYGTIDTAAETIAISRDWNAPGIVSLAGVLNFRDYGSYIEDLKRGETVVFADAETDPRTAGTAAALKAISAQAVVNMPVTEAGDFVALLYLNHATPRSWPAEDLALIREVADRTRTAIERLRAEEALQVSEESLRLAVEAAEIGTWDLDLTTDVLTWSARTKAAFGVPADAEVSMADFYAGLHPDDVEATSAAFRTALDPDARATYDVEYRTVGPADGVIRWVAAKGVGLFDGDSRCVRALGTAIDITARKAAEEELRRLNETLEQRVAAAIRERQVWADMLEATDDPVAAVDEELRFIAMNRAYQSECERLFGVRFEIGRSLAEQLAGLPAVRDSAVPLWRRALAGESLDFLQSGEQFGEGSYFDLKFRPLVNREGERIGAFQFSRNVTEQVRAQRQLQEAEEALRQAQKMEAVGQLTGGIAHDFNNMLAVVLGSLDLLTRRIDGGDPRAVRYIGAATEAAQRAATLTQRLLAFSRQQPLKPEPVNPNRLVSGMSNLLNHSLGGAVVVETVLAAGVWLTHADPNQLENVILNLAVNARDAMPDGGRLTIETQNAHIDARYAKANPGVAAGQYVLIAVTDTGLGMSAEVLAKAFDPFFTTKAVGRGTGLGLSQVYGFVKQTGGHVQIYSEIGQGTTIKIYLPRLVGAAEAPDAAAEAQPLPLGEQSELILVVEDEPAVRQLSVDALTELGYRVLEADGAAAALKILEARPDIDLLFTDVVMPEVNGKRLADEALKLRPGLKVLFTTGYTRNAVVHNGVLDEGVELIGKPYSIEELAAKVRFMFEGPVS